jgi:hypothetical protein
VKIAVSRKHIERGLRQHNCSCPIALAIAEALGRDDVRVSNHEVAIGDGRARLPLNAIHFIEDFDGGYPRSDLAPFEFELICTGHKETTK